MPCDPGDGNACSGVCQPDFSQSGAPMSCLLVDADILDRLKRTSLDGIDCSPTGAAGSDCAHSCSAGACVATNATQGAACTPSDFDSGASGFPVTVCSGSCDGDGSCVARATQSCNKYGRGELDACLYTACSVADNAAYCEQFASPVGVSCSSDDPCVTGQTCATSGCSGGTRIAGCTESEGDASLGAGGGGDPSPTSTTSSSGGCSLEAAPDSASSLPVMAGVLAAAVAVGVRRQRRRG